MDAAGGGAEPPTLTFTFASWRAGPRLRRRKAARSSKRADVAAPGESSAQSSAGRVVASSSPPRGSVGDSRSSAALFLGLNEREKETGGHHGGPVATGDPGGHAQADDHRDVRFACVNGEGGSSRWLAGFGLEPRVLELDGELTSGGAQVS